MSDDKKPLNEGYQPLKKGWQPKPCCRASKTDHPCALKIDQGRTLTFGASAGWECNARA